MKKNKLNIAIIGFGRFGALLAEIMSPLGNVFIISSREINNKKFKQIGYEDLGIIDIVIPAVPISAVENMLKKINPFLKKGSLVMDVSSVKVWPCRYLKKEIRKDVEIIGTHPMFGPDSAKNGLKDLQMVICPLRQSKKTLDFVKNVFRKMGLKIIVTTPEDHDRQAAMNLALVHFIGRGLGKMGVKKQEIMTKGFERLLTVNETVNNDTWQLYLDMNKFNPYSRSIRASFIKELIKLENMIKKEK